MRYDYSPLLMLTEFDVLPMPVRKTTCPSSREAARLARTWLRGSVTSLKQGASESAKVHECNVQSGRAVSYRNLSDIINTTATNLNWVIGKSTKPRNLLAS